MYSHNILMGDTSILALKKSNWHDILVAKIGDFNMKKNGFTIVEILAVIVVLAAVMALVIPNLTESSSKAKNKLYDTKISMIEKAAILYAQDNYNLLVGNDTNITIIRTINSDDLITTGYYVADKETDTDNKIIDPRTNQELNVDIEITINTINKKITAKVK